MSTSPTQLCVCVCVCRANQGGGGGLHISESMTPLIQIAACNISYNTALDVSGSCVRDVSMHHMASKQYTRVHLWS